MADSLKHAEQGEVHETQSNSSLEGSNSNEKPTVTHVDLDRVGEEEGYVLDEATLKQRLGLPADAILKKAKNGKTVLIPQPSWVLLQGCTIRIVLTSLVMIPTIPLTGQNGRRA
jgi:hypothetical protein